MIRHKIINGICYLYETKQTYKGKCEQHNKKKAKPTPPQDAEQKARPAEERGATK